jgi:hypothetical protein
VPIISGVQQQILKYLDEHADADVATLGSLAGSGVFQRHWMSFKLSQFPGRRATLYVGMTKVFAVTMKVSVG